MMLACPPAAALLPPMPGMPPGGSVCATAPALVGPLCSSQDSCQVPGAVTIGGQQALNSYRNAGAALLHAMQHRDHGLSVGARSGGPSTGGTGPSASGPAGGHVILSTSPGKPECGVGTETQDPSGRAGSSQPPVGSSGVQSSWTGAGLGNGAGIFQPTVASGETACTFGSFGGGAPVAALGLLAPAGSSASSEVEAPSSCRDVAGVPTFSEKMVRNTFIDFKPTRSPSVERFFEERKVRSSPTSRQISRQTSPSSLKFCADFEDPFAIATPTGSNFPTPNNMRAPRDAWLTTSPAVQDMLGMPTPEREPEQVAIGGTLPVLRLSQFISEGAGDRPTDTVATAAARLAHELRQGSSLMPRTSLGKPTETGSAVCSTATASAPGSAMLVGSGAASTVGSGLIPGSMETTQIGTVEVSRGSALHAVGACKPCAFVFQDGCANGTECEFCHLCDPGERKRRKKERRKLAANWKNRFGHEF